MNPFLCSTCMTYKEYGAYRKVVKAVNQHIMYYTWTDLYL